MTKKLHVSALVAIVRFSSRELMVLLYILCAHVMERSLHPDFIAY